MEKSHLVEIGNRDSFIGFVVMPDRCDPYSTETKEEIARRVLMFMGFKNIYEYIEAIPGWCHTDSEHTFRAFENYYQLSDDTPIEYVFVYMFLKDFGHIDFKPYGESVESYLTSKYESSAREKCGRIFLTLTTSEMKQTYGFKNMPKKKMWFCSDWKETEDEPKSKEQKSWCH